MKPFQALNGVFMFPTDVSTLVASRNDHLHCHLTSERPLEVSVTPVAWADSGQVMFTEETFRIELLTFENNIPLGWTTTKFKDSSPFKAANRCIYDVVLEVNNANENVRI